MRDKNTESHQPADKDQSGLQNFVADLVTEYAGGVPKVLQEPPFSITTSAPKASEPLWHESPLHTPVYEKIMTGDKNAWHDQRADALANHVANLIDPKTGEFGHSYEERQDIKSAFDRAIDAGEKHSFLRKVNERLPAHTVRMSHEDIFEAVQTSDKAGYNSLSRAIGMDYSHSMRLRLKGPEPAWHEIDLHTPAYEKIMTGDKRAWDQNRADLLGAHVNSLIDSKSGQLGHSFIEKLDIKSAFDRAIDAGKGGDFIVAVNKKLKADQSNYHLEFGDEKGFRGLYLKSNEGYSTISRVLGNDYSDYLRLRRNK